MRDGAEHGVPRISAEARLETAHERVSRPGEDGPGLRSRANAVHDFVCIRPMRDLEDLFAPLRVVGQRPVGEAECWPE